LSLERTNRFKRIHRQAQFACNRDCRSSVTSALSATSVKAQFTSNRNLRATALLLLRYQRLKCNRRKAQFACNRNCRSIDLVRKRHSMRVSAKETFASNV
jgi:hypothetical protein